MEPGMRLAAASAKRKGATKLEFQDAVRHSIIKMAGATSTTEQLLSKIEASEQSIDEIWDNL